MISRIQMAYNATSDCWAKEKANVARGFAKRVNGQTQFSKPNNVCHEI